jgi:hypothetical protein
VGRILRWAVFPRQPVFRMWRMPLIISRFLTLGRFIGLAPSTEANCSSVSQNRFDIAKLPSARSFESNQTESRQAQLGFEPSPSWGACLSFRQTLLTQII